MPWNELTKFTNCSEKDERKSDLSVV